MDLGTDTTGELFVQAVAIEKSQIVCMSALLTTTMPAMKHVISALSEAGQREKVKVMIGDAPVTQAYAEGIGADAYAPDAANAARKARQMVAAVTI